MSIKDFKLPPWEPWKSIKRFEREKRKQKKIQQLKDAGQWPWPRKAKP